MCRVSLLKSDDFNLKNKSDFTKFCENCDMGIVESVQHILPQCPYNEDDISTVSRDTRMWSEGR